MFGSMGVAPSSLGVAFVSQASLDGGLRNRLGVRRRLAPVGDSRRLTRDSFYGNTASPKVPVDPCSLEVPVDGRDIDIPRRIATDDVPVFPVTTRLSLGLNVGVELRFIASERAIDASTPCRQPMRVVMEVGE